MSGLAYFTYPGFGEHALETYRYNQAVRAGDRIECSGQGGWDRETSECPKDIGDEIDQAFENVDVTIKAAGGKGCGQIYRINSYHTILDDDVIKQMIQNIERWIPDHKPIWTCIGVAKLALPDMRVEIEVVAHDPK